MKHIKSIASRTRVKLVRIRAWLHRRRFSNVVLIGITGSAGKTTTKDLCASVLEEFGPVVATDRSHNVAMSVMSLLLRIGGDTRYCVAEMGVSRPGVLKPTVRIARPNIGVLTLVARDHYSAFRSIEAIADEKAELIYGLPANGTAVINIDDPLVKQIGEKAPCRVISIGRADGADVQLVASRSEWPEPLSLTVRVLGEEHVVHTRLHGEHLAMNVLASLGVAVALKLPMPGVLAALSRVSPASQGRMQSVRGADGVSFIRDDFKSPHWSLGAALEVLRNAKAERKIVVVGSVSDSPDSPSKRYLRIARDARKVADLVVFVGRDAPKALKARTSPDDQSVQAFLRLRDANTFLQQELRRGDLVLLKGTNKQDHLVRVMLDRSEPVICWRENCKRQEFCANCALFRVPESASEHALADITDADVFASTVESAVPVVAGLGNAGSQYADTPHNAGHSFIDSLAEQYDASWQAHPLGECCTLDILGQRVVLFKPAALMNSSGPPVRDFLRSIGGHPQRLTVAHDEIDLSLGDVRLKRGGGDAGHKGIRSVIDALGTEEFSRLRIGVRSAADIRKAREVVLERFSPAQMEEMRNACERGAKLIESDLASVPQSEAS
jgi:aminoacyl-tRNA hydrolase